MGLINGLMDRTLPEITLPGTHDSAAYWLDACDDEDCRGPDFADPPAMEWLVSDGIENETANDVARAHSQTVYQQLHGGIRSLDLRVTRRNGVFRVYHGLLGQPLATVLQDIRTFMEQSEQELVIVGVSHLKTGTNDGNDQPFSPELHQLLMQQIVDQLGSYLYPRNSRTQADLRATTLGQVVADGPKVLLIYGDEYFWKCEEGVCDFGAARNDPHFERFWHLGYTTGGGYTDTVRMFDSMPCPRPVMPPGEPLPEARGQFTDQKCKATEHAATGDLTGFGLFQTLTANEDVVKAKGTTTVSYYAVDRVGNAGPPRTLQVRADQRCDFNRDGRADMADYAGLRRSLDDRRLWVVGDLNGDGEMSHQEWSSCLYMVLGRGR